MLQHSEEATHGVIATYETMEDVDDALRRLADDGFPVQNLSVLTENLESSRDVHGFVTTGDIARSGAGWGAWLGGIFGVLSGVALVIVPGVGPVLAAGSAATWIAAALEGAGGGAVLGGLIGAGTGHFVEKRKIPKYEETLRAGKYLLIAHGDSYLADRAQKVLADTAAQSVDRHGDR
jgi:hypothetical protein